MKLWWLLVMLALVGLLEPATGVSLGLAVVAVASWKLSPKHAMLFSLVMGALLDIVFVRTLGHTAVFMVGFSLMVRLVWLRFGETYGLSLAVLVTMADVGYRYWLGVPWYTTTWLWLLVFVIGILWLTGWVDKKEGVYLK